VQAPFVSRGNNETDGKGGRFVWLLFLSFLLINFPSNGGCKDLRSDDEIAKSIVQESRQQYYATGHPCACPDDLMRNGRRCGNVSAYVRPGGAAPLCYVSDVTKGMIDTCRAQH
jgi:hypothetical protein